MTYSLQTNRIFVPDIPVAHRDDEYDSSGFDLLVEMQRRHFWYQGRHRFLLRALEQTLSRTKLTKPASVIDLGGGCGGWVSYLREQLPGVFDEIALSDSSLRALELAGPVVGEEVGRYQTDLLNLGWENRWDVVFLLDVLEHIPADREAMIQIRRALKPGGLLFVTTPALECFRSYNDEIARHVRRYAKSDFERLAGAAGLRLLKARYFMFFLSPLLWLSRRQRPALEKMDKDEILALIRRTHRVPAAPINNLLKLIFNLETPLGLSLPFPWGTSVLGIFQKPPSP